MAVQNFICIDCVAKVQVAAKSITLKIVGTISPNDFLK